MSVHQADGNPACFLKFGKAGDAARVRLYCFAHAGGTAATYAPWARLLAPEIEVCAVELPGHGTRMGEEPETDVRAMTQHILPRMIDLQSDRRPFAFYGHSLGAVVAYETALAMRDIAYIAQHAVSCIFSGPEPLLEPLHLFVGAARAPHLPPYLPPLSHLDQDDFLLGVQQRYGGISEAILAEPELLEMVVPPMRADFAAYESYRHGSIYPLSCPITAFAGSLDPVVSHEAVSGWADHTSGPFRLHLIPGDHFFLADHREQVLGVLSRTLLNAFAEGLDTENVPAITISNFVS